jgi:hypothetical protein
MAMEMKYAPDPSKPPLTLQSNARAVVQGIIKKLAKNSNLKMITG